MAYSPTAAVAQASGRTSGERAMNATNVSSCSTVTALPPARAGSGGARARGGHGPLRLVHERKRGGQRKPKRGQGIRPRHPRFHLPLPPVRHSFVRVNLNLLRQAAIFQDLDDGELARVSEVCREQKFAVGQQVFKEGEPGNRLFIISEGEVRISRTIPGSGEEALAVLKPGACFGEIA